MTNVEALAKGLVLAILAEEDKRVEADILLMDLAALCNQDEVEQAKKLSLEMMGEK